MDRLSYWWSPVTIASPWQHIIAGLRLFQQTIRRKQNVQNILLKRVEILG